jgi:predicted  nucleic acid-binding Zn-ribbon protein
MATSSHNGSSIMGGSADGSRYDHMLGTITALQSDLQRTMGVCQALREENDRLKSHYDAVKTELLSTRDKYKAQRAELLEAVEAKMEGDKTIATVVHKWRVQLDARTRELEAVRSQLAPQDMGMLRAQVAEELEEAHRRRLAAVEAESEKHRQAFFNLRREHERCKAEYEQYTVDQGRELEALTAQHSSETHALRQRLTELETAAADASRNSQEVRLQRRVDELIAGEAQLRAELSTVRSDKERVEEERHSLALSHRSELAAAHATAAALEADKQAVTRRADSSAADVVKLQRQCEEARSSVQELREEVQRLKDTLAAKDRHTAELRTEAKDALERALSATAQERADLRNQNEQLSKRAAAAERRAKDAVQSASERCAAAAANEERLRREAKSELAALRSEVTRLEEKLDSAQSAAAVGESSRNDYSARLARECDTAKSEAARLLREKEALHEVSSTL